MKESKIWIEGLGFATTSGIVSFEYEKDADDPLAGLAESLGYVKGVLAVIQVSGFAVEGRREYGHLTVLSSFLARFSSLSAEPRGRKMHEGSAVL